MILVHYHWYVTIWLPNTALNYLHGFCYFLLFVFLPCWQVGLWIFKWHKTDEKLLWPDLEIKDTTSLICIFCRILRLINVRYLCHLFTIRPYEMAKIPRSEQSQNTNRNTFYTIEITCTISIKREYLLYSCITCKGSLSVVYFLIAVLQSILSHIFFYTSHVF